MATVNQTSRQADLQQLLAIYNAGKLAEAEQRAKALIQRFPDALVLRNILGASLIDQGKTSDAVDCFRSALELEPRSPEGHNNLGIALQRHGAYAEAATSYREAVNLKPDHAEAHNNLGVVLADLGLNDDAIKSYQSALAHAPEFAEAHNNLGVAFAEFGAHDLAIGAYRKALQKNPDYPEAHNNLGIVLQKQKMWEEAMTSFRQALEFAPRYAAAYNNLGHTLQDLGRLDEALDNYQIALDVEPGLPQTLNNLGNVYRLLDRFDDSIATFAKVLEGDPDNAETLNILGVAYKDSGKIGDAMACYRRALALKPDLADAHINLGGALLGEDQIDAAIESYRAADPQNLSKKASALILECYYRKSDKTAFDIQLQMIKLKQESYNFRAGAVAAFVAHQYGAQNAYPFCGDPIANVATYNLFEDGAIDQAAVAALETAVDGSGDNERFAPGHISSGYKSVGNLFNKNIAEFADLEVLIRRYVDKYHELKKDKGGIFIESWPAEYALDGWYIRLLKGGEITAHIHAAAWLSGTLYLKVPNKKGGDEGNIEFTLRGYELPVLRDDYPRKMIETFSGALVLFPSSLPHRVIPFTSDEERICIPFDIIPK